LQIATRDISVLPKRTAEFGEAHRAVESTYPRPSDAGAATADGVPTMTNAAQTVTMVRRWATRIAENITSNQTIT